MQSTLSVLAGQCFTVAYSQHQHLQCLHAKCFRIGERKNIVQLETCSGIQRTSCYGENLRRVFETYNWSSRLKNNIGIFWRILQAFEKSCSLLKNLAGCWRIPQAFKNTAKWGWMYKIRKSHIVQAIFLGGSIPTRIWILFCFSVSNI